MNEEYTREAMISYLTKHFHTLNYLVDEYSKKTHIDLYDVRVPLFCSKGRGKDYQEVFIEVVTTSNVSKEDFFNDIKINDIARPGAQAKEHPIHQINNVSPLHFYRYYFPWAQVYYAIAEYATKQDSFNCFRDECKKNNIGLLKVTASGSNQGRVEAIFEPLTLSEEFCKKMDGVANTGKASRSEKLKNEVDSHLLKVQDYLVFYPDPRYRRRPIVARDDRISLFLINKLPEIKILTFNEALHDLSSNYRVETRGDYEITCEYVQKLWDNFLGLKYPDPQIQEKFEEIFFKEYTYREHFLHQFQVFLLGSIIIDKLYNSVSKGVLDKFAIDFGVPFENTWLAAATYHDYNYSTQKYKSWFLQYLEDVMQMEKKNVQEELSKLNLDFAAVRENFLQTAEKILAVLCKSRLEQSEDFKEVLGLFLYEKIVTEKNHALTSGVTLLKIYKKTIEAKRRIAPKAIEQAALSISLHDKQMWEYFCGCKGFLSELSKKDCSSCRSKSQGEGSPYNTCNQYEEEIKKLEILKHITLEELPLLYLLIFCDSCHDEGRGNSESRNIKSVIDNLDVDPDGKVTITLIAKDDVSFDKKTSEFKRVQQFLSDGNFTVILKLEHTTKKTSFVL